MYAIGSNVRFMEIDLNIRICSERPLPALTTIYHAEQAGLGIAYQMSGTA
jgi:hypothetical protein